MPFYIECILIVKLWKRYLTEFGLVDLNMSNMPF